MYEINITAWDGEYRFPMKTEKRYYHWAKITLKADDIEMAQCKLDIVKLKFPERDGFKCVMTLWELIGKEI